MGDSSNKMPNFLIIGAPKAGSTTLHFTLRQHPDIYMCPVKEAGFFWAFGENINLDGPGAAILWRRAIRDLDEYKKQFAGVTVEKEIGETSVRYLSNPRSPGLIQQFIPNAKLIVNLRHPADRAFSSYIHFRRDGLEPSADFREAFYQEKQGLRDNWATCRHLNHGFYFQALQRYYKYFNRQQLHVSLFEDLTSDFNDFIRGIFRFLNVDDTFDLGSSCEHNVSGIIRNPLLRAAWARSVRLRSIVRPLFNERLRHTIFEWVIKDQERLRLSPELRAELTEYYREDIERLQELINRDLGHWLSNAIR